uniref:Uncharacterized protein n=1 Tax=Triticum urartu TaxID=4572 RepID=A0A8R7V467_TRIUA
MPPPPPPPDSCGVRRAGAMALRSPSSTWRRNLGPPYSPPADSLTPTSQVPNSALVHWIHLLCLQFAARLPCSDFYHQINPIKRVLC